MRCPIPLDDIVIDRFGICVAAPRRCDRRLGGRADAIGEPIKLDGTYYTLAGVLPASVGPLEQGQEFFVAAQWTTPPRKGPFFITALARLRHDAD